jgi:hypothetical protein
VNSMAWSSGPAMTVGGSKRLQSHCSLNGPARWRPVVMVGLDHAIDAASFQ